MAATVKVNDTLLSVTETEQYKLPVTTKVQSTPTFKIPALLPQVFKRPLPVLIPPTMDAPGSYYHCDKCQQNFFTFPQLVRHKQFHDEERPFPCGVCGKRFLSRSHYNEHQRVHTGERPYPCDQCERSFTTHHNLKRHQSIHCKEEMYRCKTCGVLFCQKHVLPFGEGPTLLPPDMEHDSDSDPEPIPSQEAETPTLVLALNQTPALPNHIAHKSDVLRQYRLQDKLQQQLEQKLSQMPRLTNQTSFNSNCFLPVNLNVSKKKKKKKEKKEMKRHLSVPMTSALGKEEELWSVHKKPPKMHRIAYDIEVVL